MPAVTVVVITHNGRGVIPECLLSLRNQTIRPTQILVINNASTDGTPEWVRAGFPEARVVDRSVNSGPNPARNEGIRQADAELVLLVDDDAVLDTHCLEELLAAWKRFPDAAVWTPRIVYHDRPDTIQWEGTRVHYLMEAILLNPDTPIARGVRDVTATHVAGGVCYLLSRSKAFEAGLFDEEYFFGRTDAEFTFRLSLAGHKIYSVPRAVCYHRVKRRGVTKVYHQVRNRWRMLLTSYRWRTIALISPALLLYELSLLAFLLRKGAARDYFRATGRVVRELPATLRKRERVQRTRKIPDRQLLHCAPMNMRADLLGHPIQAMAKRLLDGVFGAYWILVRRLIP
jgi:hypothetical protein